MPKPTNESNAPGEVVHALATAITRRMQERELLRIRPDDDGREIRICREAVADTVRELWPQIAEQADRQARARTRKEMTSLRRQLKWAREKQRLDGQQNT